MEKATISLLVIFFCIGVNAKSCTEKINELEGKQPLLGEFRPKCQPNGLYQEKQCHENSCYCVNPTTGEEIEETRVSGTAPLTCSSKCILQRREVMKKGPMPGAFQPQCEKDGSYKTTQCHASTGYCYCVIPETGEKVLGTELRFSKPKSCEMTACVKQRHEAIKSRLMGVFTPVCEADGSYKATQSQEGFYFCVFPKNGKELLGTRSNVRGQKPKSCKQTACTMERHEYLGAKRPLLGKFKPKCNEDGTYQSVQCKAGWCYCVFPNTGEKILGTTQSKQFQKPVSCEITECVLKRSKQWEMVENWKLLGVPMTRCDPYGKYQKMQCRTSTCWCVDPDTGKAIDGTSSTMQWKIPKC